MKHRGRYWPARIEPTKIEHPSGRAVQLCRLYMGEGKEPHAYTRLALTVKEIVSGRRATLPWRRIK